MIRAGRLVLVRHGESMWNITDKARKRTTRFTGWADVPLSDVGREQSIASGKCLNKLGITFDAAFTSVLTRSMDTFELVVKQMRNQRPIPVEHNWRLNERHYGSLVGLSKEDAEKTMGKEEIMKWRKTWDGRPPPMTKHPFYHSFTIDDDNMDSAPSFLFDWKSDIWNKPLIINRGPKENRTIRAPSDDSDIYGNSINRSRYTERNWNITYHDTPFLEGLTDPQVSEEQQIGSRPLIPQSESLADTADRVWPLWRSKILPRLVKGETVLVVGHSNTIRSMCKHMDHISDTNIVDITIPSAIPIVYDFKLRPSAVYSNLDVGVKNNKKNTHKDSKKEEVSQDDIIVCGKPSTLGMRGRYVVTKELLGLTLAALEGKDMCVQENLDDSDEFRKLVQSTMSNLQKLKVPSTKRVLSTGEGVPRRLSSLEEILRSDPDEPFEGNKYSDGDEAVEMDAGWMTFKKP